MSIIINVFARRDVDLSRLEKQSNLNNKAVFLAKTAFFGEFCGEKCICSIWTWDETYIVSS